MAAFNGFFNSVNGDRKYKAEDFASYFSTFIGNGVSPAGNSLKVTKLSDSMVEVGIGTACINGYLYKNNSPIDLTISTEVTRVDRVVLRLDLTNRILSVVIISGTSTQPPALTRTSSIYDLSLAKITIKTTGAIVEDERGVSSLCGYMAFLGKNDLQSMWNLFNSQWDSKKDEFAIWFTNVQGKSPRATYIQSTAPTDATTGDIWIGI